MKDEVDWKARALKAEKAVELLLYVGFQRKPMTDAETRMFTHSGIKE